MPLTLLVLLQLHGAISPPGDSASLRVTPRLAVRPSATNRTPAARSGTPRPAEDSMMAPGVSAALARHRAAQISGVRYAIQLDVTRPDTAIGHIGIRFRRRGSGDVILDFRGPSVGGATINGRPHATLEHNGAHLRLPASALRNGENTLELSFGARISPAGASIIRFHDDTDGNDYLYTLLVPSDANALFPCFDQPDLKARVTLSLGVRPGWTAIANGITQRVDSAGGRRVFHFRETEPLSTYLIAFAAGPWKRFDSPDGKTPLFVRASRAREVEVDSLHDQIRTALTSLERYFGIPYPFQQFQYLLAPAFPFGGMEHPGAVFFNEETFIYREPPTLTQRLGRRATIYHEVAHQWFGDFVTMRWFDDLWLKEGFATYMAAKMQAMEGQPDAWMTFYLRNKPAAYDVDVTAGTTPVWQELANLDQAKSNYGAIVYNKAPGVLKQLDYLVGDSAFRRGVHDFLVRHRYGNATWRDLLAAIGKAAGRPLDDWGAQYILRPGMPIVDQQWTETDGRMRELRLVQRPAQTLSGKGAWPMRLEVLLGRAEAPDDRVPVELRADTTLVRAAAGRAAPDLVYANAGDYGYALVLLDERTTTWLERNIGGVEDTFLRAMLWGSLWDQVREARLAPARFATVALTELPRERNEQIAAGIVGRLARALTTYMSDAQRSAFQQRVEGVLLAGASDTTKPYGIRKSQFDAYVDVAATPAARARLEAWLDSATAAGLPLRQPSRWSIVTTLLARGHPAAEPRFASEVARDTTTGGRRRAFVAGAARPSAESKRAYFDRYFRDSTLNEEWATASLRAFNDPEHASFTLPFLVPALDTLPWIQRNRRIFFLGSWLNAFLGGHRDAEALRRVDQFLAGHPGLALDLRRKILQARDDLERTVRIRAAFAAIP